MSAFFFMQSAANTQRVLRFLYRNVIRRAQALQRELQRATVLAHQEVDEVTNIVARYFGEITTIKLLTSNAQRGNDTLSVLKSGSRIISERRDISENDVRNAGFALIKHLGQRADALSKLVYDPYSEATTEGIKVTVRSSFNGFERNSRYLFKYDISISNGSAQEVTLLSRIWHIFDTDGRETTVEGPGVIGEFPTLKPNETFSYSSGTPLITPVGTQFGEYRFKRGNSVIDVKIAPFALILPSRDKTKGETGVGSGDATAHTETNSYGSKSDTEEKTGS